MKVWILRQVKVMRLPLLRLGILTLTASVGCSQATPPSTVPSSVLDMGTDAGRSSRVNRFSAPSTLPFGAPRFDRIVIADFEPALEEGMRLRLAEMRAIGAQTTAPTFDNTIVAMERAGQLFDRASSVFGILAKYNTNDSLQAIQRRMAPRFAAHEDAVLLDTALFARVKRIYDQRNALGLDAEQSRLVERHYQAFVRGGAQLGEADKARLRALNGELSTLSTQFANRVLAGAKAAAPVLDRADLAGLSERDVEAAADAAKGRGIPGKYVLALQNTTQQPALALLTNRAVRRRMFDASVHRNDRGDSNDTRAITQRIAQLRAEKAKLLGFSTYSRFALDNQLAKNPDSAIALLTQLAAPATMKARRESAAIQTLIDKQGGGFKLEPWDRQYYAEQVRRAEYDVDDAQVKPYLELDRVLRDGVFFAANRLYGLTFKERHDLPVYQPDVRVFEVFDADGSSLALFYCDYFKRDNKVGGAWTNPYLPQSSLLGNKPVLFNVANFTKPAPGQPALLTFSDTRTMFHEFGHALHRMFSRVRYPTLSSTSTTRDFVEAPSQFNEHWALEPAILANYAKHYQTGEPMPPALVDRIRKSNTFDQGFATTETVAAALLDLAWHSRPAGASVPDVDQFERDALSRSEVDLAEIPPRYHTTYFSHIWSGGYASMYYAYLWSELIDDDMYSWFTEHGGMTRANGQRFRDMILSRGDSQDLAELFRAFRGRGPRIDALLVERGLTGK
jgi:peptidyl-dipeptidase Dcp